MKKFLTYLKYTYNYIMKEVYPFAKDILIKFYNKILIFKTWLKNNVKSVSLVFILCWSLFTGIFIGYMNYRLTSTEDVSNLDDYSLYEIPTVLYDIKGRKITEFYLLKRRLIKYNDIPKPLIDTLLIAEDKNFLEHFGIDFFGIMRAFAKNIFAGGVKQGGSTVTQQLAKLSFTKRERNIIRKIRELWLSLQIEKRYTKKEILEMYFNKVYYGNNCYGIETAARFYLGKSTKDLNYADSAFLVSIPPAPYYFNPLSYPLRVRERQVFILSKLVSEGIISKDRMEDEIQEFWNRFSDRLANNLFYKDDESKDLAPYFSEYVRRILIEKFQDKIYTGGYRVYTTIDLDAQLLAQKEVKKKLIEQEKIYRDNILSIYSNINVFSIDNPSHFYILDAIGYSFGIEGIGFYKSYLKKNILNYLKTEKDALFALFSSFNMTDASLVFKESYESEDDILSYKPEGALVSIEVKTGRIISMVGGKEFTPFNQINRAYQSRRQPGSAFKPFVYLAALLTNNFSPASTIKDVPIAYKTETGEIWAPSNFGQYYHGRITLRNALRKSVNIVSVRLIDSITVAPVIELASKVIGIPRERFREDFSLGLGTSEVTPLELAKGYGVFANMGKDIFPHPIIRVQNKFGKTIIDFESEIFSKEPEQLVEPQYVYVLIDMMKDVITRGTASGAATREGFSYPYAAGKTGTSSNLKDAWFAGFTPDVVTVVWVGFDKGITLGPRQFGGVVAAPIWMRFMKEVIKSYPVTPFPYPENLIRLPIDPESGLRIPTRCISETSTDIEGQVVDNKYFYEIFVPGTEPKGELPSCEPKDEVDEELLDKIKIKF